MRLVLISLLDNDGKPRQCIHLAAKEPHDDEVITACGQVCDNADYHYIGAIRWQYADKALGENYGAAPICPECAAMTVHEALDKLMPANKR